jgi:hypothetical protein
MAVPARGNVFETHDMKRVKNNGVSVLISNDDCPRCQQNELGMRDGVLATTRDDRKRAKSILKPCADVLNIHGTTVPIRKEFVKSVGRGAVQGFSPRPKSKSRATAHHPCTGLVFNWIKLLVNN